MKLTIIQKVFITITLFGIIITDDMYCPPKHPYEAYRITTARDLKRAEHLLGSGVEPAFESATSTTLKEKQRVFTCFMNSNIFYNRLKSFDRSFSNRVCSVSSALLLEAVHALRSTSTSRVARRALASDFGPPLSHLRAVAVCRSQASLDQPLQV